MGKTMTYLTNGPAGSLTRSADELVISMAAKDSNGITFGMPVVLNATKTGVQTFKSTSVAADVVGFAVRSGSKTPNEYGSSVSKYNMNEIADILVRGSMNVTVFGSAAPEPGGTVYIVKATGRIVAAADGDNTVELPGVKFRGTKDTANCAEIVILNRLKI